MFTKNHKTFYPVLPYNSQFLNDGASVGEFNLTRKAQTNVLSFITENASDVGHLSSHYDVSPSDILKSVYKSVGILENSNGHDNGTGVLISRNFALLARHCIAGEDVRSYGLRFGYFATEQGNLNGKRYNILAIVEDNHELDYVIVQLEGRPGDEYGCIMINTRKSSEKTLILLHYPLGKPLQVSVHDAENHRYSYKKLVMYHDTDFGSSGGGYIDPAGKLYALHIGCTVEERALTEFNVRRYAIEISKIIECKPTSIIAKLASGELKTDLVYKLDKPCLHVINHLSSEYIEAEAKENRKRLEEAKRKINEESRASRMAIKERQTYGDGWVKITGIRDLVVHFNLGLAIFSHNNIKENARKIVYRAANGWCLNFDKGANYFTVTDSQDRWVALDYTVSNDGKDAKFHYVLQPRLGRPSYSR